MNKGMQIKREVSDQAEQFYAEAQRLGTLAAEAMGKGRRSQMTGLENIAETAFKSSDVFDYIKKQMARFDDWRDAPRRPPGAGQSQHPEQGFGAGMLEQLEILKLKRDIICDRLKIGKESDDHRRERQQIYLDLIRQFIRQVVVQYEYRLSPVVSQPRTGQRERSGRGGDRRTTA